MQAFPYWLNAITTNKAIGDAMGVAIDPDPNAQESFTTPLRPVGSADTVPSAWFTSCCLSQSGHDYVSSFIAGEYPQVLINQGITAEQIDYARTVIVAEVIDRDGMGNASWDFLASHGYEIVPE